MTKNLKKVMTEHEIKHEVLCDKLALPGRVGLSNGTTLCKLQLCTLSELRGLKPSSGRGDVQMGFFKQPGQPPSLYFSFMNREAEIRNTLK